MPLYEINFTAYNVIDAADKQEAEITFKDWMRDDLPEIEVDRIIEITDITPKD